MRKLSWLAISTLVLVLFAIPAMAGSAQTSSGNGCAVKDADGVQYWDTACEWHLVWKTDRNGNVMFVHYQDHGQVPETAPRPATALFSSTFVGCGGCMLQGTYEEVVTPSGEYHSSGPN